MKFDKNSVGILIVLKQKELDRVEILDEMKKITTREMSSSALITSLTQLLKTELISARSDRSPAMYGGTVEYYAITQAGHQILKSIKTGFFKRGKVG